MVLDRTLYCAGYVSLHSLDDGKYKITKQASQLAAKHFEVPVKLVLDHSNRLEVGNVLAMKATNRGLFCVAVINSAPFLHLLYQVAHTYKSDFKDDEERLCTVAQIMYPSFSLSSKEPREDVPLTKLAASYNFIQHVSLCSLGARRGTCIAYGIGDIENVLKRFKDKIMDGNLIRKDINANYLNIDYTKTLSTKDIAEIISSGLKGRQLKHRQTILERDCSISGLNCSKFLNASMQDGNAQQNAIRFFNEMNQLSQQKPPCSGSTCLNNGSHYHLHYDTPRWDSATRRGSKRRYEYYNDDSDDDYERDERDEFVGKKRRKTTKKNMNNTSLNEMDIQSMIDSSLKKHLSDILQPIKQQQPTSSSTEKEQPVLQASYTTSDLNDQAKLALVKKLESIVDTRLA